MTVIVAVGSRWRARMLRMTSAEWTPSHSASRQAASTAESPSLSTAVRMVTICRSPSSAPASLRRTRSSPLGRTQFLNAGLAGQHGHVVPEIEHGLIAAEGARMIGDDAAVLTDLDSVRIGSDLDRPSDRAGADRVAVIVEPHEAGLRDRGRHRMEAVEATRIGHERRPLALKGLPDGPIPELGMAMGLGVGDRLVEKPGVQLLVALHPHAWGEEPLAHEPDLVLDLSLLPGRSGRARDRVDQVVAAHLQEAAIVGPLATGEDRLHRRFHVVVDAALTGALEEGERPIVRVKHHLLALAWIGPHEGHARVAEPDVRDLDLHGHASISTTSWLQSN